MLETSALQCMRGDRILFSDLSLSVRAGELLYVRGENGAGKTSLLRLLCGLTLPAAGEVRWNGKNIRQLKEEFTKNLMYLGHRAGIKAELTALENLRFNAVLHGYELSENAALDALKQVGLRGREDLPAKVLSQGQQRRVALARLLISPAKLWILDEPYTALDVKAVQWVSDRLDEHLERDGMVVLTTHQEFKLARGKVNELHLGSNGGLK
jgi:heme exporter protein A